MGTSWSEIITDHAMVEIDDVRLIESAREDAAAFMRKMALYMVNAIPLFNMPPEMTDWLETGIVYPQYGDFYWESTAESTTKETQVDTGMKGYELFSCAVVRQDAAGTLSYEPYSAASYDAESGIVTFPAQDGAGISYTLDFYTDGSFAQALTMRQKQILGLCVAAVWDERFYGHNWLNDQMKVKDASFETVNEGTYMEKSSQKHGKNRARLMDALHKYEQDCAHLNVVRRGRRSTGPMQFV